MIDKDNMKAVFEQFPEQCRHAIGIAGNVRIGNIDQVIVAGIGGSAFAGDVLKTVVNEEIAVSVNRDYFLPKNADRRTLVFAISYSGNTEETISCVKDAKKKKCRLIGISSGGALEKICKNHIRVPSGVQPRCAMGYLTIPMITVLQNSKLIKSRERDVMAMVKELKNKKIEITGKKIANILHKKIPLIYSSEKLQCISYGWKTRINENSKIHAFAHSIPELDHNELVGYTKKNGDFYTIIIRDREDYIRNKKRFNITKKLIESLGGKAKIIDTVGSNLISRVFCTLYLGDWVSYYLAIKNKVDPTPVNIITKLKNELKR